MTVESDAAVRVGAPRTLRNFGTLLGGEAVNKALRFVAAAVLARALTASEFGLFNIGIALSGVCVTLATLGLAEIGARELSRRPHEAALIAGRVLSLRLVALVIVLALAAALAALVWPGHWAFLAAAAGITAAMVLTGEWFARGLEQMSRVARGTGMGGAVALLGSIAIAFGPATAVAGLVVFAVAEVVASAYFWTAAARDRPRLGFDRSLELLRPAAPIAVSTIAVYAFYANVDTVILGATRSTADAGYYSGAYRLFLAVNIVAIFAAYAFYPALSRDGDVRHPQRLAERLGPAMLLLCAYGAGVLGGALLVGRQALMLLFGDDFGRADEVLVILCVSSCWYCAGYVYGYNLIAIGHGRRFSVGAGCAGLTGLALAGVLIPSYGMIGAAAATTVAVVAGTALWLRRDGFATRETRLMGVLLVALTGLAVTGVAVDSLRIPAGVVALAVAAALALRYHGDRGRA